MICQLRCFIKSKPSVGPDRLPVQSIISLLSTEGELEGQRFLRRLRHLRFGTSRRFESVCPQISRAAQARTARKGRAGRNRAHVEGKRRDSTHGHSPRRTTLGMSGHPPLPRSLSSAAVAIVLVVERALRCYVTDSSEKAGCLPALGTSAASSALSIEKRHNSHFINHSLLPRPLGRIRAQ